MAVRRRGVVKGGLGAVIAAGVGMPLYLPAARAQAFPSKPMTFIVPWPAVGSSDITLRAMCEVAGKVLGQPYQIDNKGGASGTLGPATMAATARPDGYTLSQFPISVFRLPVMQKTITSKPLRRSMMTSTKPPDPEKSGITTYFKA